MKNSQPSAHLHLVFTGGGTGGHLFPGLAVAQQVRELQPAMRITFAGTGKPFEREHVTAAGFDYVEIPCQPLPRNLRQVVPFLRDNLRGFRAARRLLDQGQVRLVVGLGGYASVPTARAAVARGIPLVLLEQNALPGRATRWLARSADLICAPFAQTRIHLRCTCPVEVTGNPIRLSNRVAVDRPTGVRPPALPVSVVRRVGQGNTGGDTAASTTTLLHEPATTVGQPLSHDRRILILGGSRGARVLNEQVPRTLYRLGSRREGWQIVHQSGTDDFEQTVALYRKFDVPAQVVAFIEDVPGLLTSTDLVVSRAGGSTLAELAAAGVPAVLVPYPHAADDHQRHNAEVFARPGGCILLDQREDARRFDHRLADVLGPLLTDETRRRRMATVMRRFARPDAASVVARQILGQIR